MRIQDRHRLLIIEPDPDIRANLVAYLQSSFDVVDVARGDEGVRYLVDHDVDVVLTEIDLPGELGLGVLAELRASEHAAALVAIYGYGDRFQRLEPLARRVADVLLVKPLELAPLERTLLALCERHGAPGNGGSRPSA